MFASAKPCISTTGGVVVDVPRGGGIHIHIVHKHVRVIHILKVVVLDEYGDIRSQTNAIGVTVVSAAL
jgi:hypothetical protein